MPIVSSRLAPDEVHVWALRTDPFAAPERIAEFETLLSDSEREAVGRFRTRRLTERYVVSHALLRRVVGRYVNAAPNEIRIADNALGRPFLPEHPETDFNLSHTDGMSVVAVTRRLVGIDIERLRDNIDAPAVAGRVFSSQERATIPNGVAASHTPFFDYWTLKEAYSKAIGLGVRVEFSDIDISLGEPMTIVLQGVNDDAGRWAFELHGCHEYRLAIAVIRQRGADISAQFIEANDALEPQRTLDMNLLGRTSRHIT